MLNFYKLRHNFLKFTGNERLDLIHRLSTNEVISLPKFGVAKTILTSDKGRFVDILTLFNFGDFVFVLCSFNNSGNVISHLDKYTIMDDFKVENKTGTHESFLFYGDKADDYVKEIAGLEPSQIQENKFIVSDDAGKHLLIYRNDDNFGGYIFIYASEYEEHFAKKLFSDKNVKLFGIMEDKDLEHESKRIEYGIPKFGNEMNGDTNPLECSMERYVSFTKGCYIGQEVISRLDTYDKVSRHLIGIRFKESVPQNSRDIKITLEGNECGIMTSNAASEKFGNIGLGFIKTGYLDFGKDYKLKVNDHLIDCKITKLPFEN